MYAHYIALRCSLENSHDTRNIYQSPKNYQKFGQRNEDLLHAVKKQHDTRAVSLSSRYTPSSRPSRVLTSRRLELTTQDTMLWCVTFRVNYKR